MCSHRCQGLYHLPPEREDVHEGDQEILDLLMDGFFPHSVEEFLGLSEGVVSERLLAMARERGLHHGPWRPSLRLIYLEAKRRGLLGKRWP